MLQWSVLTFVCCTGISAAEYKRAIPIDDPIPAPARAVSAVNYKK